jgi:alkylation response protein AidB-like acyl-CoA dehydrogenase
VWNSYAHVADWGILLARTNWDVPKHRGISYFLVDMTTPGVEPRPLRQITGVAHFNETFLTDVHIPDANLLGGLNNGWAVAQTTLMNERALIGTAGGSGLGFRDWIELARHYGKLGDPDIRQRLAEFYTRAELLKWLGQRAQASMRAGKGPGSESSVAKLFASLHIEKNGDLAMAIEGADAMLYASDAYEDGFWQQQFLGQWGSRIGGGTEQVQRNILGERVLGLPSEPRPDKTNVFREIPKNM